MDHPAIQAVTNSSILLTPHAICQVLSISRRTLRYWISKDFFPKPLRVGPDGRLLRRHPADLVDYLKKTRGHVGAAALNQPTTQAEEPGPV